MLLDELMPVWDTETKASRVIHAPAPRVWVSARAMGIRTLLPVRLLLNLRELPSRLSHLPLEQFPVIAETPGVEVVRAICGPLWAFRGNILNLPPQEIPGFQQPGYTKAYWSFHVEVLSPNCTRLTTITRTCSTSPDARERFLAYWHIVGPVASAMRHYMLRVIDRSL